MAGTFAGTKDPIIDGVDAINDDEDEGGSQVTFQFKIHYFTPFGKSLYVVGNIPELGCWNPRAALRLKWTYGHVWTARLTLNYRPLTVEYKYIVASTDDPQPHDVLWERGTNRYLNATLTRKLLMVLDDVWNFRKLVLRLDVGGLNGAKLKDTKMMVRLTEQRNSGNWEEESPKKMHLAIRKLPGAPGGSVIQWEVTLQVSAEARCVWYKYLMLRRSEHAEDHAHFWEREERKVELQNSKMSSYKQVDSKFHGDFAFNKIDDSLYIGPYPQSEKEIRFLAGSGIRAVLSLQTEEEIQGQSLDMAGIRRTYQKHNMHFEHVPIDEHAEPQKIAKKLLTAAASLHRMLASCETAYVHCTTGNLMATEVAIVYLYLYRRLSLEEAFKYVTQRRPMGTPRKGRLLHALSTFNQPRGISVQESTGRSGRLRKVHAVTLISPGRSPA